MGDDLELAMVATSRIPLRSASARRGPLVAALPRGERHGDDHRGGDRGVLPGGSRSVWRKKPRHGGGPTSQTVVL